MGKTKKLKLAKTPKLGPLHDQIHKSKVATSKSRVKRRDELKDELEAERASDEMLQPRLAKQILKEAQKQIRDEQVVGNELTKDEESSNELKRLADSESEEEEEEEDVDFDVGEQDRMLEKLSISAEEAAAFDAFLKPRTVSSLKDLVEDKQTELDTKFTDHSFGKSNLDPRVVELYAGVAKALKVYRSGKVPKAFKVLPCFHNWEDLVLLTKPDEWSSAAMFRATKLFISNLTGSQCQRYIHFILLPRVRDEIDTYQRLNFHLYQTLRKALFKPAAFFKGFLLPLVSSGTCTLREAIIVGSVLAKCSVPMLHACAAMLKLAEMSEYNGATSIFLRILLDKKYALPFRVVDALVFHFLAFRNDARRLPVLWHQCLLTFTQRYKNHISSEQRDALLELLRTHNHHVISGEIRRELNHAQCTDNVAEEPNEAMDT